jgi:ABC-type branched-subunit amino acid transport system substrate-binding protein
MPRTQSRLNLANTKLPSSHCTGEAMRDAFGQPRMLAAATTTVLMALVVSRAPGAAAQGAKGTLKSACANMNPICLGPKAFEHAHRKQCKNAIHFAAVFPMSRRNCIEGVQAAAAAQQAVQDINTNGGIVDHKILGSGAQHVGHCLVLHTRDSQDDPGMALAEVDKFMKFGAWEQYAHIDAVIGGFSSPVSEAVQQLVQWSSIPQVSYGSTSPHFADKVLNPTFSRTVPSADVLVNGIVRLVQTLEWE